MLSQPAGFQGTRCHGNIRPALPAGSYPPASPPTAQARRAGAEGSRRPEQWLLERAAPRRFQAVGRCRLPSPTFRDDKLGVTLVWRAHLAFGVCEMPTRKRAAPG